MTYTWNDLVKLEKSRRHAESAIKKGKYKKVAHGVYVDNGQYISELEQLFLRYPHAILTLQSAFAYYDLSDYIPDKYNVATPNNSHMILSEKVSQSYMDNKIINIGKNKIETKYGYINIYDKERMLIELFRLKAKLPHDYFMEVVSSYRKLKTNDEILFWKVSDYCQKISRGQSIMKKIQEMI